MRKGAASAGREYISKFYRGNRLAYCCMILSAVFIALLNLFDAWFIRLFVDSISGVEGSFGIGTLAALAALDVVLLADEVTAALDARTATR